MVQEVTEAIIKDDKIYLYTSQEHNMNSKQAS